ncbi:hypothetical protein DSL72_005172 [Monilinia vaccinii-corymbosi]|uniref:Hydrophobin n=1 Tax=Monilinia vaccinii-corymbosi TaxID=61207 RepID=A0A8A3PEX7_9HELO|nr:hypothetical protein DSL72_005172 [Monilinia vaccinii-corymbosi]
MHASFTAVVSGLLALNVAAIPNPHNNGGTPTSTWGSTSPTGAPACADGSKYTCTSNALLSLLTCTNILNGLVASIPLSILRKERDVEVRTSSKDGDYCCTSSGLLTLSCLNVANGATISLPISIL